MTNMGAGNTNILSETIFELPAGKKKAVSEDTAFYKFLVKLI